MYTHNTSYTFNYSNTILLLLVLLLSTSNLIASKFEATPSSRLFSSRSMSHKKPYSSSPLAPIWVRKLVLLVLVSREKWRRSIKELAFWVGLKWWWYWWVGMNELEKEVASRLLYPTPWGMAWLVGDDEANKVRDDGVVSYCRSLELLSSSLLLWKTLHNTQSSWNIINNGLT